MKDGGSGEGWMERSTCMVKSSHYQRREGETERPRRTDRTLVNVTLIHKSTTLTVDMLVHTVLTSLH